MTNRALLVILAIAMVSCGPPDVAESGRPGSRSVNTHLNASGSQKAGGPEARLSSTEGRCELRPDGRPLAIGLSPDGRYVAVDTYEPKSGRLAHDRERVEIWDLHGSSPRVVRRFDKDAHRDLKWHPTLPLILVSTDVDNYWVLHPLTGTESPFAGGYPTEVNWFADSRSVFLYRKDAGESPPVLSLIDTQTGRTKAVSFPGFAPDEDHYSYTGTTLDSRDGDFAVEYVRNREVVAIGLFPRQDRKWLWKEGSVVPSGSRRAGATGMQSPKLVGWLLSRYLVYAMVPAGGGTQRRNPVQLWTCKRDGSQNRKWIALPDAGPPADPLINQWIAVSGNGTRVAYIQGSRVIVRRVADPRG